ncbi:hypothetical protein Taro_012232 [Colocasia esculenta]|uniref:Triacylglycerol lipase 2 n=1 Tax=Colocasia esculenta TaxID=4460 RepID=A0A843UIK7_COLES|nr:hypothetical protein [Colocasia esculenta]
MATRWRTRPRPPTSFLALFFFFFFILASSSSTLAPGVRRVGGHRAGGCSSSSSRGPAAVHDQEAGLCASVVIPYGYKCEEFDVVTEDGYILSMQRIPGSRHGGGGGGPRAGRQGQGMQPVLLQHGVLMMFLGAGWRRNVLGYTALALMHGHIYINVMYVKDGMTWLMSSPEESLAYVLADRGFDVWIANTRGTRWSRRHETLDPSSPAFWNWSWDELAKYDLPATVDFVYQKTGKKLDYVGHSMGTLIALASFSEGRLVDKLRAAALLSPVAYLSHITTPLGILAARAFVDKMYTWLGIAEFDPMGSAARYLLKVACQDPNVNCYDLMTSFTVKIYLISWVVHTRPKHIYLSSKGKNYCLNESTVEFFLKYEPQSTSTRNMVHLAQTFRDGPVLAKFDHGSREANMKAYGKESPPRYNMSAIPGDLPLFLSHGGQDALADVRDVELLLSDLELHGPGKLAAQFVRNFAHADFVMGVCARAIVYGELITFFDRQNQ